MPKVCLPFFGVWTRRPGCDCFARYPVDLRTQRAPGIKLRWLPIAILTSGVDPRGRPISFVLAGMTDKRDGSGVEHVAPHVRFGGETILQFRM